MSKNYFKVDKDTITIQHTETVRMSLFVLGIVFTSAGAMALLLSLNAYLSPAISISTGAVVFSVILAAIGIATFIASFFFKPVYTTFNRATGLVTFHSAKLQFSIPFSSVIFVSGHTPSATYRMRYYEISVFALSEKPLFPNQRITNPHEPAEMYRTLLCTYRCSNKMEGEESIEQLQRFMGALPPEPEGPSKYDRLLY